jgi:pSer/pThr/pTyr-binding forkhead associated (FHA) protein
LSPDDWHEQETVLSTNPKSAIALQALIIRGRTVDVIDLPASGELKIGRYPRNQIVIDDESISRFHAVLRLGPIMTVEDLGSANGCSVRDRAMKPGRPVEVGPGDAIRVGEVWILLQRRPKP